MAISIKNKIFSFLLMFSLFCVVVTISFLSYKIVYAEKIYPGLSFMGIDLSGKKLSEGKDIIDNVTKIINNKKIIIISPDAKIKKDSVSPEDLGVNLKTGKTLAQIYDFGHRGNFLKRNSEILNSIYKNNEIKPFFEIEEEKFQIFIKSIAPDIEQEAKNGTLIYKNESFIFQPSTQQGKKIDLEEFKKDLYEKISEILKDKNKLDKSIEIVLKIKNIPAIITDESQTTDAKNTADKTINKQILLTFQGRKFSPSKAEIASWIVFTEKNGALIANLNDSKISIYLNDIAKQINIEPIDQEILVNLDGTPQKVLNEKKDGQELNKNKALSELKKELVSNESREIKLEVDTLLAKEKIIHPAGIDSSIIVGREDGKYIDINTSAQKLAIIEKDNVIGVYPISSGKWSMPTPAGEFKINSKNPRAYSRKYNLYMPYWMAFISGDYGIHELPEWANGYKEGANHLGTPVSHGCVRLGIGAAEVVYNWSEIGTSVYVHK